MKVENPYRINYDSLCVSSTDKEKIKTKKDLSWECQPSSDGLAENIPQLLWNVSKTGSVDLFILLKTYFLSN